MKKLFYLLIILFAVNVSFAQITTENRQKIFNQVWKTINEKYYDENFNGVDWDKVKTIYQPKIETAKNDDEFYGVIKAMVRELQDAHTRFWTPKEAELKKNKQYSGIGLNVDEIEGKLVIVSVAANSEEEKNGIKVGMLIEKIDGRDSFEIYKEAQTSIKSSSPQAVKVLSLRSLFRGKTDSKITLTLTDKDNKTADFTITRRIIDKSLEVESKRLDENIGYIKFDTFDSKLFDNLKKAVESLKDTNGLIIDLRDNGGGEITVVMKLAAMLLDKKTSFGKTKWREKQPKEFFIDGKGETTYKNPIAILIDKDSASGSELLSQGLQESGRAKIFGSTSCGCLLGIAGAKEIKDGELEFSQIGFVSAKGYVVENKGVVPDTVIDVKIADFQNSNDRILKEAKNYLLSKKNL
ncbi:MAG: S41 family peptidase [Pyrinomonadaceae bacterium]|jgi:carboxyl-terminal processing protease|nr:S41 family peptidase [Pyrinomonadaceae bacterium]